MRRFALLAALAAFAGGCPVTSPLPAGKVLHETDEVSGAKYSLYVPTWYTAEEDWPLVITLHGTFGWDGRRRQTLEWAYLAEKHGFIVMAPALDSVQGILPVIGPLWREDLARDRQIILSLMDKLGREYNIDADSVLLTGFSAGGFPMYDTGLRDPDRFQLLVGRSCNSSIDLFEDIVLTDEARQLPIFIFWGKDDPACKMGWQAYEYLRMKGFKKMVKREIDGGHWRRPGLAYDAWVELWAARHRSKAARLRPEE